MGWRATGWLGYVFVGLLTDGTGGLAGEPRKRLRVAGALARRQRLGWPLISCGAIAWPRPLEHDAQPHQSDQHQLVEKEMRYHGKTPSYRWSNEGILPGLSGCRISRRIQVHDRLPGSARVAAVKGATRASHWS